MKQLALELASPPVPTLDNFVAGNNAEVVAALRTLACGDSAVRFVYPSGGGRPPLRAARHSRSTACSRWVRPLPAPPHR